ncbi:MAG: VWA domain-containing protein [Pseudomonadales bacterium]|nr:VWA domain-containing protein [Pseudomonadales bacterium]
MTLGEYYFMRPLWLLALIPALVFLWRFYRIKQRHHFWENKVDAHLLKHLLLAESEAQSRLFLGLLAAAWLTAIICLAGLTWEKHPAPTLASEAALVIAFDVSRSMDVADVYPSRLDVAKAQLQYYLRTKKEGSVALVLFAEEAFLAAPLSVDVSTALDIVKHADTRIIPVQGSRPDRALITSLNILKHDGRERGQILLITDGAYAQEAFEKAANRVTDSGYALAILGVGTEAGGVIPDYENGGVISNAAVTPSLDESFLSDVADDAGGVYATLSEDEQSVASLVVDVRETVSEEVSVETLKTQQWLDRGPWLLVFLVPLASLAFRRGWVGSFLLFTVLAANSAFLVPANAQATEGDLVRESASLKFVSLKSMSLKSVWQDLWIRKDYQAYRFLKQNRTREAAIKFEDSMWKGGAWYRQGQFKKAEEIYAKMDTAEGHFNRGNALAQQGKLEEAMAAYSRTLQLDLKFTDAAFNRRLIKEHLQERDKLNKLALAPNSKTQGGGRNKEGTNDEPNREKEKDKKRDNETKRKRDDSNKGQMSEQEKENNDAGKIKTHNDNSGKFGPSKAVVEPTHKSTIGSAQWLNMIVDSPSELLRLKFAYKHKLNPTRVKESDQPW